MGFIASLYFIFGSISISGKSILMLSGTYWGYNKEIAKALSSQRAGHISGSLALFLAFLLQLCSVSLPQAFLASSPLPYENSVYLILLSTLLLAFRFHAFARRATYKRVLSERQKEDKEDRQENTLR